MEHRDRTVYRRDVGQRIVGHGDIGVVTAREPALAVTEPAGGGVAGGRGQRLRGFITAVRSAIAYGEDVVWPARVSLTVGQLPADDDEAPGGGSGPRPGGPEPPPGARSRSRAGTGHGRA